MAKGSILYGADARLHRTRWLFDRADELMARVPGGVLALMVITAQAGLPDAPTRAENAHRLERLGNAMRRLVTVPLGDAIAGARYASQFVSKCTNLSAPAMIGAATKPQRRI